MNMLPIGQEQLVDASLRASYFEDLERLGFDVACSSLSPGFHTEVDGKLQSAYTEFVKQAHAKQMPACIQLPASVCTQTQVPIEEAQYDLANNPAGCGDGGFFISFASSAWLDRLKQTVTQLVKNCGFDWVIFEESAYRVDIPGTKDRFYQRFINEQPDVEYPTRADETEGYVLVQQEKAAALLEFCRELTAHAKSVGAKKVGMIPWFFTPTTDDGSAAESGCDVSHVAQVPDVDLIVVRMEPSTVYSGMMSTGDDLSKSPKLHYIEVMAHAVGKAVITLASAGQQVPFEFYRDSTLASLAAQTGGFYKAWTPKGEGDELTDFLVQAAPFAERLGQPKSPVAFVFSDAASHHPEPLGYESAWRHYWALVRQMAFSSHAPLLTFRAETLDQDLGDHPEVQVLIFEEHFPLSVDQMMVIRKWWQRPMKQAIVAFGSGLGLAADPTQPGPQPTSQALPGVMELIGLAQEPDPQYTSDHPIRLRDVSRVRRSAFLEGLDAGGLESFANVRRVFGSRAAVIYEADVPDARIPIVAEWRDRLTLAIFCGFGLSQQTASLAERAIIYALREVDAPQTVVVSCDDGILWNVNRNDYVVLSNLSDQTCAATGKPGRATFWDCRAQEMLPEGDPVFKLEPHTFQVYRIVGRRSKFFDVIGASQLGKLIDGAGRAELEVLAGKKVTLVLRASPKEVLVDGRNCTISQEIRNDAYHVTLNQCPPGEHHIALKW